MAIRRTKYRFTPEFSSVSLMGELECMGRVAVVPGETVDGVVKARILTDTVVHPILNSVVFDMWAFYVPHRLAWTFFPDFIMGETVSPPLATGAAARFYENGSVAGRWSLFRHAYRLIWNEYFRHQDQPEWDTEPVSPARTQALQTFETRLLDNQPDNDRMMALDNGEINVTGLRREMARDRFSQRMSMYGSKYSDFLRQLGVDVASPLIELPEFLSHSRVRVSFTSVADSTGTEQGYQVANGYANIAMPITRKAFAEHGHIVVVGAMRPRAVNAHSGGAVDSLIGTVDQYWKSDGADESYAQIAAAVLDAGRSGEVVYHPAYEHYRQAMDHVGAGALGFTFLDPDQALTPVTAERRRYHDPQIYDRFFVGNSEWPEAHPGVKAHYAHNTWMSLTRTSPVLRRGV